MQLVHFPSSIFLPLIFENIEFVADWNDELAAFSVFIQYFIMIDVVYFWGQRKQHAKPYQIREKSIPSWRKNQHGSNSYCTEIIVSKYHNKVNHWGIESTLNRIRCKYRLIKEQTIVNSITRKYVTCRLIQAKCFQPPLTPLPLEHCASIMPVRYIYITKQLFKIFRAIYSIHTCIYLCNHGMYTSGICYRFYNRNFNTCD